MTLPSSRNKSARSTRGSPWLPEIFRNQVVHCDAGPNVVRAYPVKPDGAGYSASLAPTRGTYVDNLMTGGALGVPLWGLLSVIAIPLFANRAPEWTAEEMRTHFPSLVAKPSSMRFPERGRYCLNRL